MSEVPLKNKIQINQGRTSWFNSKGEVSPTYIIAIGGGSASGKTRVAQSILQQLNSQWVVVIAQDNFYRSLSPSESKSAFQNDYDFDCPAAFDYDALNSAIRDLKECKAVLIPNYSFTLHQRLKDQTSYIYGASIVIVEGIFALHDKETRDLCDLKIFVQCDSDLMLARRLRRDLVERGRDAEGVLDQYLKFVKPSFDTYINPTAKYADIIVPGSNNEISIELISSHIRRQLDERKETMKVREELWKGIEIGTEVEGIPKNLIVLEQTNQLKGIHTILRNKSTSAVDFQFFADRLSTLVIELALSLLPTQSKSITTSTGINYIGEEPTVSSNQLCGVSILRSGATLEKGLRQVIRDARLGSILIDSDQTTGEALLFHLKLPSCIISSRKSAEESTVLLLDSQIGTGAAALLGIRILLDHGCLEENILFTCLLVSRVGGIWAIQQAFPKVRIITSAVDPGLEERWIFPDTNSLVGQRKNSQTVGPKKVFAIIPGIGSFGERYFGA